MKMKIPMRLIMTAVIACLLILWLREFTLRRAIQSTANFMAPFNKQSNDNWEIWKHKFGIIQVITKDDALGHKLSIRWRIWYEPDALRNGTTVHVNLLGKVTYVGYGEIMEIIRLKEAGDKEGLAKAYKEMKPL
jgi:hypothetical protein